MERFCEELRGNSRFAEFADEFRTHLTDIDRLADESPDHAELFDGLQWIFSQQSRSVGERPLVEFIGVQCHPVVVDMESFTGWATNAD